MKIGKWDILVTKDDKLARNLQIVIWGGGHFFFTRDKDMAEKLKGVMDGVLFTTHGPGKKAKDRDTKMRDDKMQRIDAQEAMKEAYEGDK